MSVQSNGNLRTEWKAAFFGSPKWIQRVYVKDRYDAIAKLTKLYEHIVDLDNFEMHAPSLSDVDVIFTTWGMPELQDVHLNQMPSLRAVFYAAGTVKGFAKKLLARNITVVSAWRANAVPVAEFTLAQILLSSKKI